MSGLCADSPASGVQVVDLCTVTPAELESLWRLETCCWRDRLRWDVSDVFGALRRVIGRGGLPGKAVRVDAHTVGYAYYGVAEGVGVIAGLSVSPECSSLGVGGILLRESVAAIRRQGVRRIESQFVSFDAPWLTPCFEREGFRPYWREFLRVELRPGHETITPPATVHLQPWQGTHVWQAAAIMQAAYVGEIDTEISGRFCTADGCRTVLEQILSQAACGNPLSDASAMARSREGGIGFAIVTQISPRQAHLAQVAVLPAYQRRGVGRSLLDHSLARLSALEFDSLSLFVTRANQRALRMYESMGFQSVLSFPVFVWEGGGSVEARKARLTADPGK